MEGVLFLFGFIALLIIAGMCIYKGAERHTIKVTRDAFEGRRHLLEGLYEKSLGDERLKIEAELEELDADEELLDYESERLDKGEFIL